MIMKAFQSDVGESPNLNNIVLVLTSCDVELVSFVQLYIRSFQIAQNHDE